MVVKIWKTTVFKTVDASSSLAHSPYLIHEVVAQQEERLPCKGRRLRVRTSPTSTYKESNSLTGKTPACHAGDVGSSLTYFLF